MAIEEFKRTRTIVQEYTDTKITRRESANAKATGSSKINIAPDDIDPGSYELEVRDDRFQRMTSASFFFTLQELRDFGQEILDYTLQKAGEPNGN